MQNPKVSVVIPAYNEEKYIEKTLQAVLAQDYPNFEVIVVDNGSTDRTSEIVKKYLNPKLKIVEEPSIGITFARQRGLVESTGEIVAQLDADCIPEPWWISRGVNFLIKKDNAVSISGPYVFYDYGKIRKNILFILSVIFQNAYNIFGKLFGFGGFILGGNTLIKIDLLKKSGGYDTKIKFYGEDTDVGNRISKFGKTYYSRKMYCKSSARRFIRIGFLKMLFLYCRNNVFYTFFKKDFLRSKLPESESIR